MEKIPTSNELIEKLKDSILSDLEEKLKVFYSKAINGAFNTGDVNEATKLFLELNKIKGGKLSKEEEKLWEIIKKIQKQNQENK